MLEQTALKDNVAAGDMLSGAIVYSAMYSIFTVSRDGMIDSIEQRERCRDDPLPVPLCIVSTGQFFPLPCTSSISRTFRAQEE